MSCYLIAEDGSLSGLIITFESDGEFIIGRDPDECYAIVEDPMVSRTHISIHIENGEATLKNISDTNPVEVNGEAVKDSISIAEDDMIRLGNNIFRFSYILPRKTHLETPVKEAGLKKLPIESSPDEIISFVDPSHARFLIKVVSGPHSGAEFTLQPGTKYTVGKDAESCDIIFQDLSVSRNHAYIHVDAEENVSIEDLESRNGLLVNGNLAEGTTPIHSQDLVAMGTTSFLVIDRNETRETLYSPPVVKKSYLEEESDDDAVASIEARLEGKKSWHEMFIPTNHIIGFAAIGCISLLLLVSSLSLFSSKTLVEPLPETRKEISQLLQKFPDVRFEYNDATKKLFLLGHVLSEIEYQELQYLLSSQNAIVSIEDTIVVDELVWNSINSLLHRNTQWRGIVISGTVPGQYVAKGYISSVQELEKIEEYLNSNFQYLNTLENKIVVEESLEAKINAYITQLGFVNVSFSFMAGELLLSGYASKSNTQKLDSLVATLEKMPGIRGVKNFVTTAVSHSERADISSKLQVSGISKYGNKSQYILINGKILGIGDTIDGMEVTEILPHSVYLENGSMKYRIDYKLH